MAAPTMEVLDLATEEVLAEVPRCCADDVDAAVDTQIKHVTARLS
jgi:hypothetical protein